MEQDNTNNQNAAANANPTQQAAATTTTIIDTGAAADVQMASTSQPANNNSNESVLEQLQKEPQVPAALKDEFFRDLWQLRILLQNHELDKMRELAERGLPQTLTDRKEQLGPYPTLPSEKRIVELCTKLWERREVTKAQLLQTPPYDAHYNPERYREQVNFLLLTYVAEHCSNFKPSAAQADAAQADTENQEQVEQWDPHMTRDQVLVFLQLAESLLRHVPSPSLNIKSKTDNLFKGVLLFEDFEILRCAMAICLNQDQNFSDHRKEEISTSIYYPIATCPYRLFPGEAKPISKLLSLDLPLKLDIEYEYDTEEKDPADASKKLKRKVVIPYSELEKIVDTGSSHQAYDFLIAFIKERQSELKIQGDVRDWPHLQQMLFSVCAVRNLNDEASRQKCIQVWLLAMQQTKKNHVPKLQALVGFKSKDFLEDILHLLRTTKDEQTCVQILNLLRNCESDIEKANYLVNLDAEVPEGEIFSEELAPTWITKSFAYKLARQLASMEMKVTAKPDAIEEQKQPAAEEVERSAFDVDMEDESEPKATTASVNLDSLEVTRTFSEADEDEDDHVVQSDLFLSSRVQIAAARLLEILSRNQSFHERNRSATAQQRFIEGVFHVRKLAQQILRADSFQKHSDKVRVLKYHPLVMSLLIESSYWDVYAQSQLTAFQQLEALVIELTRDQKNGVHVIYCDSQGREQRDTFELGGEYLGRLVKNLLQPLGTLCLPRDRRERDALRAPSFPSRLVDSRVLEHFRTELLNATDAEMVDFVNEFLEDWIKLLVKSIDRDPALIRRMLKDKPANAQDAPEEEKKEEEKDESKPWEGNGMIPLVFDRIKRSVPAKYFMYNTLLELIKQICIIDEAKKFLDEQGTLTLEKIYSAKCELPKDVFFLDQRIFYQVSQLRQDTFQNIARHIPEILETLGKHFNFTLDKISAISKELCQAQFTYMNLQTNQSHSYQRKLRQRMDQTEQFEQLHYNVSIVQGFTSSLGQQTQEMLSKLVEKPERIKEVLAIYENLCLFKNLQQFNIKLQNLFKIILNDFRDPMMHRERDIQPEQQQAQLEKFKVFAGRIKDLTSGFVNCVGKPLDSMPTYDQIMAEPVGQAEPKQASKCRFEGLTRRQQIQWYVKTITEHVNRLDKHLQFGEQTRRDITLIDWQDCIQPQLLFQRVMPLKELEMFHEAMLQSEEDFTGANKDLDSQSAATHKKQVSQLRSALREKITEKDFKSLVTKLVEKRKQVDSSFKYVTESHYERYGLHLSENHWFSKLNRLIFNAIKQVFTMRQPAAQHLLENVRKNFREQAKALAMLATNVKLALPTFDLAAGAMKEDGLERLLSRLSSNLVNIKPISKWAKDSLRGTLLIHFVAQDGLKAIAQYHTSLQKLQLQIDAELGREGATDSLTERQTILIQLIANSVHDSLVLTGLLLNAMIVQSSKDTKLYTIADVVEDSDPVLYTSIQHFFANHYNQLLSILAHWDKDSSESDFAQILQRDSEMCYTGQDSALILLIREMASNFPNCPMLKDSFVMDQNMNRGYGGYGGARGAAGFFAQLAGDQLLGGPGHPRGGQANAAGAQAPALRDPTEDELDMIINMGFDIELATSALQMANFDVSRALELCLGDQEAVRGFGVRQRELKSEEEKRLQEREMEMALKMSMQDEQQLLQQEEEKGDEKESEEVKLVEVPLIDHKEFTDKVRIVVKQIVESLMTNVRTGKQLLNVKIDTILSLIKVALVGTPVQPPPHGYAHHPPPQANNKALIELTDEQQNDQKTAIFASVDDLVKVQLEDAGGEKDLAEEIERLNQCLLRFEFNVRLREMGYLQAMQLGQKITEKSEAFAFLTNLTMAVSHVATLITAVLKRSTKLLSDADIKFYENDAEMAAKAKQKADLVELAVKMFSVSVTTIYLIHMIVISVGREHEKALKELTDKDKLEEEQQRHAAAWITSTNPNKLVQALQRLRDAAESARDQSANGGRQEVKTLADQTTECISLVATHILSLKQWHYLRVTDDSAFDWFSPQWLKTTALDFALSFLKLGKRNDKFLNQLLSLAIYEYSSLPEASQNLLNVSLLYHTVFQTSSAEKTRQRNEAAEEDKKEAEERKDPNQVALEAFLDSKLEPTNSKVNYKNMFQVLHQLHESNPLDVPPVMTALVDSFKTACVFSADNADRHPRHAGQPKQVAFKDTALNKVQKTVLAAAKDLQDRFASLEATQKTRAQIFAGELPADPVIEEPSQSDAAEEEKKNADGTGEQQDAQMHLQPQPVSASKFPISQQLSENKKVDQDGQVARVEQIISQVKELASQSEVVLKIARGEASKSTAKQPSEYTLLSQLNLMQRVAAFTQVYPDLTPRDDQFADWIISEWLLQFAWVEAPPSKPLAKEEQKDETRVLMPNGNLVNDQKKVERILNRFCGLNRFQTLPQRTLRMNLRISLLEHALVGVARAQETLLTLQGATTRKTLTSDDLVNVQIARSKALVCLAVLKALISEPTCAMVNRVAVIPETFQKSIYYLLLRGRPVKDKSTGQPAPINFSKTVSAFVKLSDRFLTRQSRMAAPPAKPQDQTIVDVSMENGSFFHGHLVNLSVGCLIDICQFIDNHLHVRGSKKRQQASKPGPSQEAQRIQNNNNLVVQDQNDVLQHFLAAANDLDRPMQAANINNQPAMPNLVEEMGPGIQVNPAGGGGGQPEANNGEQQENNNANAADNAEQNAAAAIVPNSNQGENAAVAQAAAQAQQQQPVDAPVVAAEVAVAFVPQQQPQQQQPQPPADVEIASDDEDDDHQNDDDENNDVEVDDDEDDDGSVDDGSEEVSAEEEELMQGGMVAEYVYEEGDDDGHYGNEDEEDDDDDDDLYGDEEMMDDYDPDDLMPEAMLQRGLIARNNPANQRHRDIINDLPQQAQPELWDIGMQENMQILPRMHLNNNRRPGEQQEGADESGWTQEEAQIQRALQLIRGSAVHQQAVPQGMPERRHPFMYEPEHRQQREEQNNVLADDNTSIRELTEVFKPLKATEYIKSQVEFSKSFTEQYKKTLAGLRSALSEKKDAVSPNLAATIRSEGVHMTVSAQLQSRQTFEQQTRSRIEQLQFLMQRGPHESDIEHHLADLMAEVRNIEQRHLQMENEPVLFGGGRPWGEPRQEARHGQDADGIGAGMQSMLNQINAEQNHPAHAGIRPRAEGGRAGEGGQEAIMEEVMRQARGEDMGVFAAEQQAEQNSRQRRRSGMAGGFRDPREDHRRDRRDSEDGASLHDYLRNAPPASFQQLEQIFRQSFNAPPAMAPPAMPQPPAAQQQQQQQPPQQQQQPAPGQQQQPQLLPPNLLPSINPVAPVQIREAQPDEDDEQALIEQALLLSMADGADVPQEPPQQPAAAQAEEAAPDQQSSNVAMPSADSSAANNAANEEAKEEVKQEQEVVTVVAQQPASDTAPVVAPQGDQDVADGQQQEEQKQEGEADDAQPMEGVVLENQEASQAAEAGPEEEAKAASSAPPVPVVVEEVQQEISAFQLAEGEGEQAQASESAAAAGQEQQPAQPNAAADASAGAAEDQQMVVDAQDQPAAEEEGKNEGEAQQPAAQAEEAKQPDEEPQTFGYPNSLLIANDIEPEILVELPEEIRQAVLEPLAGQLASHLAAVAAQQARRSQQPGQEEQKQGDNNADGQAEGDQAQPDANNGIDQDYLNALPPEVRRDVLRQQEQSMAARAQPNPAELDHAAVIATIDDPELRLDMLFNLTEAQVRALPENLRREHDEGREAQAHRIAEQERHRQRQAERLRQEERAAAERHMHQRYGHGMPPGYRARRGDDNAEDNLYKVIEEVERDIFERQELANYKTQAKLVERQIETEDTLIETILRLVINQAEERGLKKSAAGDPSKIEHAQVSREQLENAQCSDLVFLIRTMDNLRHGKQSQPALNANRNKFANAFAFLLASEISTDQNQEFKKLILEDSEDSCDEEEEVKAQPDVAMEEAGQDVAQTMMIDTTQNDGIAKTGKAKEADSSEEAKLKRSASLKLALMLIGTMRVISKGFRVDLLKGLLLQEDYFTAKGSQMIQKQTDLNTKLGKQLQPPLVIILGATDSVKQNLTELEALHEAIPVESKEERKEALKEVQQARALLRNLNLLVLDIFKEFDQVIEKILVQQSAAAAKDSTKAVKTLEISREALVSLTQLLSLPEIEKKQLQSLGHAFLLISKQSKANWDLIHGEFQRIGENSLNKINDKLTQICIRFQAQLPLSKSLSSVEGPENVEMLTGAQADEEEKKLMASPIPTLQLRNASSTGKDELGIGKRPSQQHETVTLTADDKAQLAKMVVQDKEALQVLKNTIVIYNFFNTEIATINAEEEKKEADKKEQPETKAKRAVILAELKQFYESGKMLEHMTLLNDVLGVLQSSGQSELARELRSNLSCIFEAHLPDLHEVIKKADSNQAAVDQNAANVKKDIKMKPIGQKEATTANNKVLSLFKNVDEELPERLNQFSVFCLNNKKAINKLIQKNRASLGIQLADIVKYMPNLLDFESKRDYFNKEIEKQRQAARNRGGRLNIRVNRNNIFQGAYQELNYRSAAELKNKIKVTFEGEAGIDASGLTREFYTELSRAMFNPDYSLFIMTSNGVSFYANSESYINPDHLNFFKFVGRMVGKAIFDGQLLECYFARSLYKMMIGEELYFEDLSDMDNDCYRNFRWYIDNDVSDLCQYFAITRDYFGRPEEIPLKEGGSNLAVTNDNKTEYIELFTIYKMYISVKEQVDAFLGGFHEIVSRDLISIFNAKELELLISGLPNFDVADLKANTQLRGYTMDSPQIIWLFEMLETFDKHEQALFLQFVTGSSKIPLEGFRALQGMGGIDPFKVHRIRERDESALPRSHTCFNTLDLPEYPVKELMRERLLFAIKETSGFGLA